MNKQVYLIAGILTTVVILVVLGLTAIRRGAELTQTRQELDALRSQLASNLVTVTNLQAQLQDSQTTVAGLQQEIQKEREAAAQAQKSFGDEMRAALESKEVTISELQGRLTVNIMDRVLFDSGEAVLKSEGEAILRKMANVLQAHTNRLVHVAGHTDNVPIRASARSRYPSNWELSTARATAAVRFLSETAGLAPERLGALGYGEFHPVASNDTSEGRAKNRRIEIIVLPVELLRLAPNATPPARD